MFLQIYSSILSSNKINNLRGPQNKSSLNVNVEKKSATQIKNFIVKQDVVQKEGSSLTVDSSEKNENDGVLERKVPFDLFPNILESILNSVNHPSENISKLAKDSNSTLLSIIEFYTEFNNMNIKLFEEKLSTFLNVDTKESTLELILNWIKKLFKKFNENMFANLDTFIENITKILNHKNEVIFITLMDILCEVAKFKEVYIETIMRKILEKLCSNKSLLNTKGLVILKQLCTILPVVNVYLTFAEVLLKMKVNTKRYYITFSY